MPPAGDDAVPPLLDPNAWAAAEHVCERAFYGRTGGGGGRRSARIPLEYLGDDARGREVLDRLAKLARWEKKTGERLQGGNDVSSGRGVSYVKYELNRT